MSSEIEETPDHAGTSAGEITGTDVSGGGVTEESMKNDVYTAAAYGDLDKLKNLVESEGASVHKPDDLGYRALQWAALNNRVAAAQYILERGADVNAVDLTGQTALHWSAVGGAIQVADLLLEEGAWVNAADIYGYRSTHVAAQYGQTAFLYHIVSKWNADPDVPDGEGRTPLNWATYKGFADSISLLLFLDAYRGRQDNEGTEICTPTSGDGEKFSASTSAQTCQFSLAEIKSATRGFHDELIIGKGGFGKVYKGHVSIEETSHLVAIKRLDSMSNQGAAEFRAEIEMLSKLRHCHLVSLIGYCNDYKEMILVYEYMANGTLYDHLHKSNTPFSWVQRLKIAIGAARGLDYLHTGVGTQHGVIHRDVKSSNILLDTNWEAMISDFGLSKASPTNQSSSYVDASVKGTFGYLDPEYFYTGKLTRKTDIFAFGVVLFELLSRRLPVDLRHGEEQCSLVKWAKKCVKERKLDQLVDSSIAGTIASKFLRRYAQTAYQCLNSDPKKRPTMTEVVASLQALLELQKKFDLSPESPTIMGFPWKIHEYLFSKTKLQHSGAKMIIDAGSSDNVASMEMVDQCNGLSYQISTNEPKSHDKNVNQDEELVTRDVKIFTYCELKDATRDFGNDRFLGEGSYGKVYKGWVDKKTYLPNKHSIGLPIAVKKIHRYSCFDLEMLKEFRHPNLVKLIGYCLEGEQLFLVYEFVSNGNFEDLLCSGGVARLPLATKVKMAVGIARGIVFLQETQLHKELGKADRCVPRFNEPLLERHKILLDGEFTAKLSDYDVTKLVHGCYPPNHYDYDGPLHPQSNFFGFKVVFTEILTGQRISNGMELRKIARSFYYDKKMSLADIAKLCFEICDKVNSESKMVTILEKYDNLREDCLVDMHGSVNKLSHQSNTQ